MSFKTVTGLLLTFVGAGYFLIANREVVVTNTKLECDKLPQSFDSKKILVLSDLHKKRYGDNFNNIMSYCECIKPDFIFFLGDLYSRDETDMRPKAAFLARLQGLAPTYYIAGNHELYQPECLESLCIRLKELGVTVLRNAKTSLTCGTESIDLYGLQLPLHYYVNSDWSYKNLPEPSVDYLNKKLGKPDSDRCSFLLAHKPAFFEQYARWGADVTFSGHNHGGIVRFPIIGGTLSPERRFFPKYSKGIYNSAFYGTDRKLVVTAGLGKFRLNNPSEILVCTLKKGCNKNA